jgi:L-alanine-DL-glutamate epimerase-like enolase superfamily enzyme
MHIESIEAVAVAVPLSVPTAFSTRTVEERQYVIVRVFAETGLDGVGYTYAGDSGGLWLQEGIEQLLAPRLRGTGVLAIEQSWDRIFGDLLLLGRRGALMRMLSAVEIAVWDLFAKNAGVPLRYLLGGTQDTVPAYASGGYYRAGDPRDTLTAEIERYRELGFTDFKLRFGRLPLREDLERVAAARRALGPGARLAVDANNAWYTLGEALKAVDALAQYDIWWVEEPFAPDDIANHVLLTDHSPIPIATGEIEATRWGFGELIDRRAADILQPDACVIGGVSEWWRVATLAAEDSIAVIPHWHANIHAQLAAATPNCPAVEYLALGEDIYNFEQLVANPLVVADGRILLDQTPGIGVEFDWEAVDWWAIPSSGRASRQVRTDGRGLLRKDPGGLSLQPVAPLGETQSDSSDGHLFTRGRGGQNGLHDSTVGRGRRPSHGSSPPNHGV